MKTFRPLISVIMPVYKTERFLSDAISSVCKQTYSNWELLVINDGSPGDPEDIVKSFSDHRIRYIVQSNKGPSATRNNGMYESSGDYISFLDSDDLWRNDKLEKQLELFQADPDVSVVYSQRETIDEKGSKITGYLPKMHKGMILKNLWVDNCICNSSAIFSREVLNKVGGLNENLRMSEDWEFWLRVACFFKFAFVDEPLVKYRVHAEQVSNKTDIRIKVCTEIRKNFLQMFGHMIPNTTRKRAESYRAFNIALRGIHHKARITVLKDCIKAIFIYPFIFSSWKSFFKFLFFHR